MIIEAFNLISELLKLNLVLPKALNQDFLNLERMTLPIMMLAIDSISLYSHIELQATLLELGYVIRMLLFELRKYLFFDIFNSQQIVLVKINSNGKWNYVFNFVANKIPTRILRVRNSIILDFKLPIDYTNGILLRDIK
jgi:hypothetical protein